MPLRIEQRHLGRSHDVDECHERNFRSIPRQVKHRFPGEEFFDPNAVQASHEYSVIVVGLDTVSPAPLMEFAILVDEARGDPYVFGGTSGGAAEHHALEVGVDSQVIATCATPHRSRDSQLVEGNDASFGGRPPEQDGIVAVSLHGEQSVSVSVDDGGGAEIRALSDEIVVNGPRRDIGPLVFAVADRLGSAIPTARGSQ